MKNSKDKDFISYLKELSTQEERIFIVFNKKDIFLKIYIDEVKMKKPEKEFCSNVDAKINYNIKPEEIIKILKQIPKNLTIRLFDRDQEPSRAPTQGPWISEEKRFFLLENYGTQGPLKF